MAGLLPPVIATLIADTKEYMAKMDAAQAKMGEFGATSETTGTKITNFANKASTAILGVGVALGAYAVDQAYKFQESLDGIQNQTNLTKNQVDKLGNSIIKVSDVTGVSTQDLATSATTALQAGYSIKQTTELLNASAEAAVITKTSITDTTKAIVAAQTLQIAKGMDVTKLTGILVKGSKDFVGGLSAEEQMLSGRVGVALANYGLGLKTVIPLGAEFAKVGLPSRSISSFVSALGNLEKPLTDNKGKLTTYAQGLEKVGLSQQDLASDLRKGNIVGILTQIKEAAQKSGEPLSQVANAVFGTTGGGTASVLIKNLQSLATAQQNLTGAGATSLANSFKVASQQLGPQLKILDTNLKNALIPIGKLILPAASDVIKWVGDFANDLKNNSALRDVLGVGAATLFAGALALKLKSIYNTIFGTIKSTEMVAQGATQITLLQEIATNTGIIAGEGGAGGASGAAGAGEAAGAGVGAEAAIGTDAAEVAAGAGIAAVGGTAAVVASAALAAWSLWKLEPAVLNGPGPNYYKTHLTGGKITPIGGGKTIDTKQKPGVKITLKPTLFK